MIILKQKPLSNNEIKIIIIFGAGLIGTSVCNNILKRTEYLATIHPFNWHNLYQTKQDAKNIYKHLSDILILSSNSGNSSRKIAFVWCAGKAGFTASKKIVEDELNNYEVVLDLVIKLRRNFPTTSLFFHLVSSAGGLFEGKHIVNNKTVPEPKRYYGQLKHEQEKRLYKLGTKIVKKVYRPTSAYGFFGPWHRMGLIPTLISNGLKCKVSTIYGNLSTLRDYIFVDDIGTFIEKKIFQDNNSIELPCYFLASGKPSSIFEIKYIIEQILRKKIYVEFRSTSQSENIADITINSSALPIDWAVTDIKVGIRYVRESLISGNGHSKPATQMRMA